MGLVDGPRGFPHLQSDEQSCGTRGSSTRGQTLEYVAEEHHPVFPRSHIHGLETSSEWYFLLE